MKTYYGLPTGMRGRWSTTSRCTHRPTTPNWLNTLSGSWSGFWPESSSSTKNHW